MKEPIIFGVHKKEDIEAARSVNPMVDLFGRGPFRTCMGCVHLTGNTRRGDMAECAIKPKDMKRRHSAFWPACAKYENLDSKRGDDVNR